MAGIKIEGAQEIQEALLSLPDKVSKKFMAKALRKGAEPVLAQAKATCPVAKYTARGYSTKKEHRVKNEKGKMVGSYIRVKPGYGRDQLNISTSQRDGETRAIVGTGDAYYLNMQEWGTEKMKPHPFLAKALETKAPEATERIAAELKKNIEAEAFK